MCVWDFRGVDCTMRVRLPCCSDPAPLVCSSGGRCRSAFGVALGVAQAPPLTCVFGKFVCGSTSLGAFKDAISACMGARRNPRSGICGLICRRIRAFHRRTPRRARVRRQIWRPRRCLMRCLQNRSVIRHAARRSHPKGGRQQQTLRTILLVATYTRQVLFGRPSRRPCPPTFRLALLNIV